MQDILITGVSRGLGLALAEAYLKKGHHVTGIGRKSSIIHPKYTFVPCELRDLEAVRNLSFDLTGVKELLLINNAGTLGQVRRVSDQSHSDAEEVFHTNTIAPIILTQKLARLCGDQTVLTVLNISSGAGRRPIASWANYGASKAALDHFSEIFQLEEREKGMKTKVISLAPGIIDTAMQQQIRASEATDFSKKDDFIRFHQEGQLLQAADAAEKIIRLIEEQSDQTEVITRLS